LEFDGAAFEDLAWWIQQDRNRALRIINLIKEVQRDPFKGIGKPEPLKHEFKRLLVTSNRSRTSTRLSGYRRQNQDSCLQIPLLSFSFLWCNSSLGKN
jgi:Txe/YoeB family toxin of toxin-antitoxin system